MEPRRYRLDIQHRDIGGQAVIQLPPDRIGWGAAPADPQMRHLLERMDTGVGAARPLDLHFLTKQILRRAAENSGDRPGIDLILPAAILGPVVFESQFPRIHSYYATAFGEPGRR